MSKETITLSKTLKLIGKIGIEDRFDYTPVTKLEYPVQITEKLDGVPARFTIHPTGHVDVVSRQGEIYTSVPHIQAFLGEYKLAESFCVIGELTIPGEPFKAISGHVRRDEPCYDLVLNIFDFVQKGKEDLDYCSRMLALAGWLADNNIYDSSALIRIIEGRVVAAPIGIAAELEYFFKHNPEAEGVIVRPWHGEDSKFTPGKRSKGMWKYKPTPTMDLRVYSFEEAMSKDKAPLGMVGRINVELSTPFGKCGHTTFSELNIIGAGPGKLTHEERKLIWENQKDYIGKIAEIAYMRDPSYNALREARFHAWRPEKTTPSQES